MPVELLIGAEVEIVVSDTRFKRLSFPLAIAFTSRDGVEILSVQISPPARQG
jgi:hypothetical protein